LPCAQARVSAWERMPAISGWPERTDAALRFAGAVWGELEFLGRLRGSCPAVDAVPVKVLRRQAANRASAPLTTAQVCLAGGMPGLRRIPDEMCADRRRSLDFAVPMRL